MRKENVKVIIWGIGAMGRGIAEMLMKKKGIEITGAIDIGDKVGKSLFEVLGKENPYSHDVIIGSTEEVIKPGAADVVLLATDSFTKGAFDKIILACENGMNVITTAEEMAYPKAQEPELAEKINECARKNGVTVLGTGINPGLIMDLLVITLTGACIDVEKIEAKRINDLSPFGPAVMNEQGVGITQDEFERRLQEGTLEGHVGFPESAGMIADALGWELDGEVRQEKAPIVSKVYRKAPHAEVHEGNIAGVDMRGEGYVGGELKINMVHPQQVEPHLEDVATGDYITIEGTPDIRMSITPEVPGGIGTIAMVCNMIPHVINSRAGLKTMIDLPVPRAMMGDVREMIEEDN